MHDVSGLQSSHGRQICCALLLRHMCCTGSHHDALDSYQQAVSLAPDRLIHRVELGRTLERLGRKEEARQELEVKQASLLPLEFCLLVHCCCHDADTGNIMTGLQIA